MGELKKTYRTTVRDVDSQVVVEAMFIPKALLHDEVRDNAFKALLATARAFGAPMQERDHVSMERVSSLVAIWRKYSTSQDFWHRICSSAAT